MPAKAGILRESGPGGGNRREAPACAGVTGRRPRPLSPGRPARAAPASRPAASRGGHSALTICHRQIVRARLIPPRAGALRPRQQSDRQKSGTMKRPNPAPAQRPPADGRRPSCLAQPRAPTPVMPAKAGIFGGSARPAGGPRLRRGDRGGCRRPLARTTSPGGARLPARRLARRAFGADDLPPADRPGAPHPPEGGRIATSPAKLPSGVGAPYSAPDFCFAAPARGRPSPFARATGRSHHARPALAAPSRRPPRAAGTPAGRLPGRRLIPQGRAHWGPACAGDFAPSLAPAGGAPRPGRNPAPTS